MLKIRSDNDLEFSEWRTFCTIAQVSQALGIPPSSLRSQRKMSKPITCRSTRHVYEVDSKVKTKCIDCSKLLTQYDVVKSFHVSDDDEFVEWFYTLYAITKATKIYYNAWENAAIKPNPSIMHRAKSGPNGHDWRISQIIWCNRCRDCWDAYLK